MSVKLLVEVSSNSWWISCRFVLPKENEKLERSLLWAGGVISRGKKENQKQLKQNAQSELTLEQSDTFSTSTAGQTAEQVSADGTQETKTQSNFWQD